jgi:hypothetical protein
MTLSKDFDVRSALVGQFLSEDVSRSHIRHEITLNSSSSAGRGDVVIIHNGKLKACEINSGADTLKSLDRQESFQLARFRRDRPGD